jgi:hypothetical protein
MRYEIKEYSDRDGIREYHVGTPGQSEYERVGVWVGRDGTPRCTQCYGLLVAMSASCKHAQAVKRLLSKER